MDVFDCGNDTFVSRDPLNDCKFPKCPEICEIDTKVCLADGSIVHRDPNNDCAFPKCPPLNGCREDAKQCDDGTVVVRDPTNNCEFPQCP